MKLLFLERNSLYTVHTVVILQLSYLFLKIVAYLTYALGECSLMVSGEKQYGGNEFLREKSGRYCKSKCPELNVKGAAEGVLSYA